MAGRDSRGSARYGWTGGAAGRGDDVSIILYTSGTTGRSKGVMLTHARCIAAARSIRAFDQLNGRVEVLACLPMAWVGDHYMI